MSKKIINLRYELIKYKYEFNLLQNKPCSKQENKEYQQIINNGGSLPEGVFAYIYYDGTTSTSEFYTVVQADLSDSEIEEYLTYKKIALIRTIKNCIVFFTTLTIIFLISCLIIYMSLIS